MALSSVTAAVPRNGRSPSGWSKVGRTRRRSVVLLEAPREVFDVLRRPARHVHAEMQAHGGQNFLDLVQRLASKVRGAEHLAFRLLDQVADIDDVVVLQAVGRAD